MYKESKELAEDIRLREERYNMSVEEIMVDGHFNRKIAQAIWEADHSVDMMGPVPGDIYLKELRSSRS